MKTRANGKYRHSAYWYAKEYGWTHSEATTLSGQYIDMYFGVEGDRRRVHEKGGGLASGNINVGFNPVLFAVLIAVDIGVAVKRDLDRIRDPEERARIKRELMRDMRILRRPFYYERETKRRRMLAEERHKLKRRTTYAGEPTPEAVLEAWNRRKDSKEDMIRLGGMLQDLECYVDNRLRFDGHGNVVGRNGGIRGWLHEMLPELEPKYKTLMRYKAMAIRLRQATATEDPEPTERMMAKEPPHPVVAEILADPRNTFESIEQHLHHALSPDEVLADEPVWDKMRIQCGKISKGETAKISAHKKISIHKINGMWYNRRRSPGKPPCVPSHEAR